MGSGTEKRIKEAIRARKGSDRLFFLGIKGRTLRYLAEKMWKFWLENFSVLVCDLRVDCLQGLVALCQLVVWLKNWNSPAS
jgi:hypothetical protein